MGNIEKIEAKTTSCYSLLLNNLLSALYTREGNSYTNSGSVFCLKTLDSKTKENLRKLFNRKRTEMDEPFLSSDDYAFINEKYSFLSDPMRGARGVTQSLFWMAHLAGWKAFQYTPDKAIVSKLFKDTADANVFLRKSLVEDLLGWRWIHNTENGQHEHIFKKPAGLDSDYDREKSQPVSEYIVFRNRELIDQYAIGREELLKRIISDFVENVSESEPNEIKLLYTYLDQMIKAYENRTSDDVVKDVARKHDLLARALSWLVIGAMLRDSLTTGLIEGCLKHYMPESDEKGKAEERRKANGDLQEREHNPAMIAAITEGEDFLADNYQPNEDTVYGREIQIHQISELFSSQRSRSGKSRIVYIQGIGGIGKSTLARAYAEKYSENYDIIAEVSASSAREAIMLLETSIPEYVQYTARLQRIAAVCRKQCVLLIVHDYNQPEDDTFGDWKKLGCDILLTGWHDRRGLGIKTVRLDTNDGSDETELFSATEIFCANYLKNAENAGNDQWKKKLRQTLNEENYYVRELCALTGCHPLTIKVIAMQASYTTGKEERPEEILHKLHEKNIEHFPGRSFGLSKDGCTHRFGDALTHLENVFKEAAKSNLFTEEEYSCLRNMTLVPYAWGISAGRYEEWTKESADWLTLLSKKGWIEYEGRKTDVLSSTKNTGIYRMPIAIASIISRLDKTEPTCRNCSILIEQFVKYDTDREISYAEREALASEAEVITSMIKEESTELYASVVSKCTHMIHSMKTSFSRRTLELFLYRKILKIRKCILGEDHPDTATSYDNVGMSYWDLGDRHEGLKNLEKAMEIRRHSLGEDHPDTATSYDNVGMGYRALGDRQKGLKYQEKALETRRHLLGENHPDTAASYDNIGRSYMASGNRTKSIEYLEKALEIRRLSFGKEAPATALSYDNVGRSYWKFGDHQKGLRYLEIALEIRKHVLGENHPATASSYNNVGISYWVTGNCAKGLEYKEKALEIRRRVLGENHPDTAASYDNVGMSYWESGDHHKGLKYKEMALDIYRNVLGENQPATAASFTSVGMCYMMSDNFQKGLEYQEKALQIYKRVLGENQLDTALSYIIAGYCYEMSGNCPKVLDYWEKALEIRRNILGETHPDTAESYNNVGVKYWNSGNHKKGLEYLERSLKICRSTLGETHLATATSYINVGRSYAEMNDYKTALSMVERSYSIRLKGLGPDDSLTVEAGKCVEEYREKLMTISSTLRSEV